jgi:predicted transcriptional regulator
MFNSNFTMRLDSDTDKLLKALAKDMTLSKSIVIRQALKLLKELREIKKQCGQISVTTENGEKIRVLLG